MALSTQYEEDREVLTLNEPQIWAVIGTFAAALFGMLGFVMTSMQRTIKTEISSLRHEMGARFDSLSGHIDHLDRDVQFLMKSELEDRA